MNCNNCNNPLKDGAKFCTNCGSKVEQMSGLICNYCSATLKDGAKFCTSCGKKVESQVLPNSNEQSITSVQDSLSIVKNKLVWNIMPGQVAMLINEEEFTQLKGVTGLILNEGTKALVRLNGEVLGEIKHGVYNFVDADALEKEIKKNKFWEPLKKGWNIVANIFKLGKTGTDTSLDNLIEKFQKGDVFSVVLALDTPITLVYGEPQSLADDYAKFIPMNVQAQNIDLALGLRTEFIISDIREFSKRYLQSSKIVSTSSIVAHTSHQISACVKKVIRDYQIEGTVLPFELTTRIEEQIKLLSIDTLMGLNLVKIVEISVENEDLQRFRMISQELYLSEKEMDYLMRTNDFKNRLADVENNQKIHEAKTDAELYKELVKINQDLVSTHKDAALSEDELDKFYTLLSREKRIRDAKSEDEVTAALHDIAKTGLLRESELELVKVEYARKLNSATNDILSDEVKADINRERIRDQYQDERYDAKLSQEERVARVNIDIQRQQAEQMLDIEERKSKNQMDTFMQMAELKRQMQSQQHQEDMDKIQAQDNKELEMQRIKNENDSMKFERAQNLNVEQLMALAANENLDIEAQREFARSLGMGKDSEKLDKLNQERINDMKEMMQMMMSHNQSVTSSLAQSNGDSKNEYKERLQAEQERRDRAQDSALRYTTQTNFAYAQSYNGQQPPQPIQTPQQQPQQLQAKSSVSDCKSCGSANPEGSRFCEHCGSEI